MNLAEQNKKDVAFGAVLICQHIDYTAWGSSAP